MQRRPEIDGLRAVAVIPIIFFHAGFRGFAGGFVGVDVFFVISGYLICTVILEQARTDAFSLAQFYERRARRILPALFFVMLACLVFAWAWMLPDDLENFGESLVATVLFANNILLWLTSGYWELANEFKPLFHTWSLGVEEQFYLLFPLALLLILRLSPRRVWPWLLAAGVTSLAAAQHYSMTARIAGFLLLPTRIWELMLGALLSPLIARPDVYRPKAAWVGEAFGILGLALIAFAVGSFGRQTPVPGLYALVPAMGAALVIMYADRRTLAGRLLASPALVGIGLISYSLYLWHQPIFAFMRIGSLEEPGAAAYWSAIALTVICATASWRWIEQPFRNPKITPRRIALPVFAGTGAVLAAIGLVFYLNSGFIRLWPELAGVQGAGRGLNIAYNMEPEKYRDMPFTGRAKRKILIAGSSFARDFINAAEANGYFADAELSYHEGTPCVVRAVGDRLRHLIAQADVVIQVASQGSVPCFVRSRDVYRHFGAKRVIFIGTKNFGRNLNGVMRLKPPERYSYRARVLDEFWNDNEKAASQLPADSFVDVLGMIAGKDKRVPVFTGDGKIISQDGMHLTPAGARYLGQVMFQSPLLAGLK